MILKMPLNQIMCLN